MNTKTYHYFVGDFETTVYKNQVFTEVWASAIVPLYSEDVKIFNSLPATFEYIKNELPNNSVIYYHNLKFDGQFWLYFLLYEAGFSQAYNEEIGDFYEDYEMKNNMFKYSISDKGQWYTITFKINNKLYELRDSLKLLPFSVKKMGKSFKTKHQKLEIEYEGNRKAGDEISEQEKAYIANDVLVVKEVLEIMQNEGHTGLTIGTCCLKDYKNIVTTEAYNEMFPDLTKIELDKESFGSSTADEYIRKSYHGGWCYVVKGKENKIFKNGLTADVNSLYPSVMSHESGNEYPWHSPRFLKIFKNVIPNWVYEENCYYFIRFKCKFYLKPNMLPTVQIKYSWLYRPTEWLTTSDVYNSKTGKYYDKYIDLNGNVQEAKPTMTMTRTDYELFNEHYEIKELEILDMCTFSTFNYLFDEYINKYKKIKLENTGAKRELAKLFLNNLYGKMASSNNSSFKLAFMDSKDNTVNFREIYQFDKKVGFIPVGSAITSYARNFTIRTAQMNYYGADKRGFIYADTDSIHCDLKPEELKGIKVHDKDFLCWKLEAQWDKGLFVRQKTYIEHVIGENLEPVEKPYYNVKCAGMPENCKQLLKYSIEQNYTKEEFSKMTEEEKEFVSQKRTIEDYKVGLKIPSKLMPKRIIGGVVLVPTTYEMR